MATGFSGDIYAQDTIHEGKPDEFTSARYAYRFPFEPTGNTSRKYPINGIYFETGLPFLTLYSLEYLSDQQAYIKLSVALALTSLYEKDGFISRPISAIGGYSKILEDETYVEILHNDKIQHLINLLSASDNSFQIQSRFTLSHAHALMRNPEIASIEFFKVIELYIKNCAFTGIFSSSTAKKVLDDTRPQLFCREAMEELVSSNQLHQKTVEAIIKLKNVRNKFIGHGGIRPTVASIFDDPEDNRKNLLNDEYNFSNNYAFGEPFYEKVMYDIEVIAVILFCKMNQIPIMYMMIPGCWWQPSTVISSILKLENVEQLSYGSTSELESELLNSGTQHDSNNYHRSLLESSIAHGKEWHDFYAQNGDQRPKSLKITAYTYPGVLDQNPSIYPRKSSLDGTVNTVSEFYRSKGITTHIVGPEGLGATGMEFLPPLLQWIFEQREYLRLIPGIFSFAKFCFKLYTRSKQEKATIALRSSKFQVHLDLTLFIDEDISADKLDLIPYVQQTISSIPDLAAYLAAQQPHIVPYYDVQVLDINSSNTIHVHLGNIVTVETASIFIKRLGSLRPSFKNFDMSMNKFLFLRTLKIVKRKPLPTSSL